MSVENLQFVVWYMDYRDRWRKLPIHLQQAVPDPTISAPLYTSALTTDSKLDSLSGESKDDALPPLFAHPPSTAAPPPARLNSREPRVLPTDHPFREETSRIAATFIKPSLHGEKELPLDQSLRDELLANLEISTHPNVFRRAYQRVIYQLEISSYSFVSSQAVNGNYPIRRLWTAIGLGLILTSCIIAAVIVAFYPAPRHSSYFRLSLRLLAVPFATMGSIRSYGAYRGVCCEIFRRGSTQLKPWELSAPEDTLESEDDPFDVQTRLIAPFLAGPPPPPPPPVPKEAGSELSGDTADIPIFGPERIVHDERIKQYHLAVVNDMSRFGFCYTVVFTAILLSIPGRS